MPGWREEYLENLREAQRENPVDFGLVQACSRLHDRIAALEAEKAVLQASNATTKGPTKKDAAKDLSTPPDASDDARLRLDLAEALRAKGQFEARLQAAEEELRKLRSKTAIDGRTIRHLTSERSALVTKLKDRDHEIREKLKLLQNVQDEMLTLSLQLNMAEQERDRVRQENKDLVDRWMKRMAQEADAMNLANEPLFEKTSR
jgi:chromosome segregation ATPase